MKRVFIVFAITMVLSFVLFLCGNTRGTNVAKMEKASFGLTHYEVGNAE